MPDGLGRHYVKSLVPTQSSEPSISPTHNLYRDKPFSPLQSWVELNPWNGSGPGRCPLRRQKPWEMYLLYSAIHVNPGSGPQIADTRPREVESEDRKIGSSFRPDRLCVYVCVYHAVKTFPPVRLFYIVLDVLGPMPTPHDRHTWDPA